MPSPRQRPEDQRLLVRLSTKLNPVVSAILRSRFHWLLSPGLALITVTGRRTGRRFSIPVGYHRLGNVVTILVADAPKKTWWRNYHTPAPMELRLRGRTLAGEAEVLRADS